MEDMISLKSTPVEQHLVENRLVLVKREDLCCPVPGPPFSKMRGLWTHLNKLKRAGFKVIGYTETSVSMAGWGVAWGCKELDLHAVLFDPQYKKAPNILKYHRRQWNKFNAEIIPIKAGRAKVNWYISSKLLREKYGATSILLPLGLPFKESVDETAEEALKTLKNYRKNIIFVINVGSGTIASGLWKGVEFWAKEKNLRPTIYGIMGRKGNIARKMKMIQSKSGLFSTGFFAAQSKFILKDPGWEYTERSFCPSPFPCHPYYDRKAWQWLIENIMEVPKDQLILFWNIGH